MRKFMKRGLAFGMSLMLGLAGSLGIGCGFPYSTEAVEAEAAVSGIDILNYESNKSAAEFVINDIAGMEKLAELVNAGTENFDGKTVTLQADLKYDQSVENNYDIIGKTQDNGKYFIGTFKGQGRKISGVNLTSSNRYAGLFGYSEGVIEGICLANSTIVQKQSNSDGVGGIAGMICGGKSHITNCIIMQDTEVKGALGFCMAGGIAGAVGGSPAEKPIITHCVNYGTVTGSVSDYGYIGGIAGSSLGSYLDGVNVAECCNFGMVQFTGSGTAYVGGIIGGNSTGIVNCFNTGKLEVSALSKKSYIGGIAGESYQENGNTTDPHSVENCYNTAQVSAGSYCGSLTNISGQLVAAVKHSYWLKGSSKTAVDTTKAGFECDLTTVYPYTQTQLKASALVKELNKYSASFGYGEVWEEDGYGINNGYPVLKDTYYVEKIDDSDVVPDAGYEEIPDNGTPVSNLFKDPDYTQPVTDETIQLYANGQTYTDPDGIKRNTKSKIIYTDVTASYNYTVNKKGVVVPSTGKVIVGITSANTRPELVKGKIVDKDAAKIAKASIRSGQITITAQSQAGTVYLWVMDTGMKNVAVSCPVTLKMAPAVLTVLKQPHTDPDAKKCTATSVNRNSAVYVYLKPAASDKKTVTEDCTYRAVLKGSANEYISVHATSDPYCFKIKGIQKKAKGTTKVTAAFVCLQNGRSVSIAVTVK